MVKINPNHVCCQLKATETSLKNGFQITPIY